MESCPFCHEELAMLDAYAGFCIKNDHQFNLDTLVSKKAYILVTNKYIVSVTEYNDHLSIRKSDFSKSLFDGKIINVASSSLFSNEEIENFLLL